MQNTHTRWAFTNKIYWVLSGKQRKFTKPTMFEFAVKRSTSLSVEQNFHSTLNAVLRFTANPNTLDFVNFLCFPDEYIQGVYFCFMVRSVDAPMLTHAGQVYILQNRQLLEYALISETNQDHKLKI